MAVSSNDRNLSELLNWVESGKAQLPDFQRDWVWDDTKICKLIESITSGFPMGAAMFLQTGGDVHFTYRKFTGVNNNATEEPEYLVLDGQQRLTTLFQVFKSQDAVKTCLPTNKDHKIERFYYIDIRKALDPNEDRLEAILSMPKSKQLTENIGRDIVLDLSTPEKEFDNLVFPLNISFSLIDTNKWMLAFLQHWGKQGDNSEYLKLFMEFQEKILSPIIKYQIPVITLTKETSKEAVCQIFENVNTGGVPLTVFELVTATFAAQATDDFKLREDWDSIKNELRKHNGILKEVDSPNFLAAMTLLTSYKKSLSESCAVSCKKKDVLRLSLSDYRANRDYLVKGFKRAADFLVHQGVYSAIDLPYSSQLVPLAAIFAYAEEKNINLAIATNESIISRWYWCGVFGELYGGANETRFALDIVGVYNQIKGGEQPETVSRASFQPKRLLSLQTRNSAAYKGVMALILKDSPLDFMSGNRMDLASYLDESTDIHHIFPQNYCESRFAKEKWNSVVNKTPIYASTNRSIGGRAPSEYIGTMRNKGLTEEKVRESVESHKINLELLNSDNFESFIIDRATRLLNSIEKAMGKAVSGRDSEETIKAFGAELK